MKGRIIFFILSIYFFAGCGDSWIKKPEGLIPEKKMVDMIVDLHLASAIYDQKDNRFGGDVKIKSEDFYYSVLKKHAVADSVFEKSILYYSSFPKDFEKIYASALDKVSQKKELYTEDEPQPFDLGNREIR